MGTWGPILITAAIVFAAALFAFWPRLSARWAARRLHRRLAAASGLNSAEAAWLWQLAREVCREQPAMVFVRPSLVEAGTATVDPDFANALYDKLFGS